MNKLDYILNAVMLIVMILLWVFFAFCRTYQFDWDLLVLILAIIASIASFVIWWRQGKRKKALEEEHDEILEAADELREKNTSLS